MKRIFGNLGRFFDSMWYTITHEEVVFLAIFSSLVISSGTVFYHLVEKMSWVDSLYFTFVTLTTVGYGDITPQTTTGKLFTIVYIIIGIGLMATFVSRFYHLFLEHRTIKKAMLRMEKKEIKEKRKLRSLGRKLLNSTIKSTEKILKNKTEK